MTLDEFKERSTAGVTTLIDGSATVAFPQAHDESVMQLQHKTVIGQQGMLSYAIDHGVGFTITSSSASDNSVVGWLILAP